MAGRPDYLKDEHGCSLSGTGCPQKRSKFLSSRTFTAQDAQLI